jgi:hypothetical protein
MSGTVDPNKLHKKLADSMFDYSKSESQEESSNSELPVLKDDELLALSEFLKTIIKKHIATNNSHGDIEKPVLNDEIVQLIITDMKSLSLNKPTRIDYFKLACEQFDQNPLFLLHIMKKIESSNSPKKNTNKSVSNFRKDTFSSISKQKGKKYPKDQIGGRQLTKKRNARKNKQTKFNRKPRSISGTNLSMKRLQLGLVSSHKRRTKNIKNSLSGGGYLSELIAILLTAPVTIPGAILFALSLIVASPFVVAIGVSIIITDVSIALIKEASYNWNKKTYITHYGTKKFLECRFELTCIINTLDLLKEIDRKSLNFMFKKFANAIVGYTSNKIPVSDELKNVDTAFNMMHIIDPKEFTTKYNKTFDVINKGGLYSYFTSNPKDSFIEYIKNKQEKAQYWFNIPETDKRVKDARVFIEQLANEKHKQLTHQQKFIKTVCDKHCNKDALIHTIIIEILNLLKTRVEYIAAECDENENIFSHIKPGLFTKDDIKNDIRNGFQTNVSYTKDYILNDIDEYIIKRNNNIKQTCGWQSFVEISINI